MENKGIVGAQDTRMGMDPIIKEEEELRWETRLKLIQEAQEKAYEAEKERITEQYNVKGKSTEELMADYAKEDLYKEYLVHRAVLTCDQATVEDFILPNGRVVRLRDRKKSRMRGELEVDENPVSSNGLHYATVMDAAKDYNIPPFWCNCKRSWISREEMINIMKDKGRHEFGVCRHLMKLEGRWSNMPIKEGGYLAKTDTYLTGDGPILENAERESQGITMTSVLFCKQGGIIYPETSGQTLEEKEEVLSDLEKTLLERYYTDLAYDNWSDAKKKCAQDIWNKFYVESGFDADFVAGLIGNMYGEGDFGMLQDYKCDWSSYSSELKGYMIISNIEQAKVACLVAPKNYGIGAVQWSTVDRKKLLYENYKLYQLEDGSLPTEQLVKAELKTMYDEFNGDFSWIYEKCQEHALGTDKISDNLSFSTCIIFRRYEIPGSSGDVDMKNGYKLAEGVEDKAQNAEILDKVPSIIKRIIAAKVAYEAFME